MNKDTRVLYNAECPVCNFEISHYAQYADKTGLPIRFEDLNRGALDDWGLTRDAAARRLYVLIPRLLQNPKFFVGYDPEVV